ncbi:MAG: hypothetical protein WB780_20425 [Candidatus Acidiferrales bacterium]
MNKGLPRKIELTRQIAVAVPIEAHAQLKSLLASERETIKGWMLKCVEEKLSILLPGRKGGSRI